MSRMTLRLPDSLRALLETQSQQEGVSLNQYIVYALARQATLAYVVEEIPDRDVQNQEERFNKLVHRLGTANPAAIQRILAKRAPAKPENDLDPAAVTKIKSAIADKQSRKQSAQPTTGVR